MTAPRDTSPQPPDDDLELARETLSDLDVLGDDIRGGQKVKDVDFDTVNVSCDKQC